MKTERDLLIEARVLLPTLIRQTAPLFPLMAQRSVDLLNEIGTLLEVKTRPVTLEEITRTLP